MALSKEIKIAQKFLDLLETKNLDAVAQLITDDFVMVWPGGVRFDDLGALKEWGTGRFQSVKNIYEKIEAAETPMGNAVFFIGTLEGVFADGSAFSGIRFVDRILVTEGRVSELLVWSDLAEELRKRDL